MPASTNRIGVLLPTWIGDSCMATPALAALRSGFPDAEIVIIARPVVAQLLDGLQHAESGRLFDRVITYNKRTWLQRYALSKRLQHASLDSIILLTNSWWSAAAAWLGAVPTRVGYSGDVRSWLLTHSEAMPAGKNGPSRTALPPIDYYLRLVGSIGCETHDRRMKLVCRPEDQAAADELWSELEFNNELPTLVVNNNAATERARCWPANKMQELVELVANELNWNVLLHCGPGERDMANSIAARIGSRQIRSMGLRADLPISLSKAVLKKAELVVSTDSGPRHMAVALDRPVVSIFGATDPKVTQTYNTPERIINHSNGRMDALSVEEVFTAVRDACESLTENVKVA
ncbi:MAG TPA: hypothetical protein DDW52_22925 [Planctomycetaceae bacterium]|nr:hypothetical protein [Planctomycetaceae bacterium]